MPVVPAYTGRSTGRADACGTIGAAGVSKLVDSGVAGTGRSS